MSAGLLDTSVWIAGEVGRPVATDRLPDESFVSVVTMAELHAGVLAAPDTATRARRMATVSALAAIRALPIDAETAGHWAALRVQLHEAGRRVNVNDLWIAATARVHRLAVYTQDDDFDVLAQLGALEVIKV